MCGFGAFHWLALAQLPQGGNPWGQVLFSCQSVPVGAALQISSARYFRSLPLSPTLTKRNSRPERCSACVLFVCVCFSCLNTEKFESFQLRGITRTTRCSTTFRTMLKTTRLCVEFKSLVHPNGARLVLAGWIRPERSCSTSVSQSADSDVTKSPADGVEVRYVRGLPQLTIPLPSRRERCLFTLRPVTNCVGDLIRQLLEEDRGIDRVVLRTPGGDRIASSNSIESLMEHDFDLVINDVVYRVQSPAQERLSKEEMQRLSDVQNLVMQLYEALHVGEHQLRKERQLLAQLEQVQAQLLPLEQQKANLVAASERRTTMLTWAGLGLMAVQFGALARLTWWEYSWDIMEPITYFVTYGTSMAAFAYYVLTKQEYILPDVRDRQFLMTFHKRARKVGLDVQRYNDLRDQAARIRDDLDRLRDPLRVQPSTPEGTPEAPPAGLLDRALQHFRSAKSKKE